MSWWTSYSNPEQTRREEEVQWATRVGAAEDLSTCVFIYAPWTQLPSFLKQSRNESEGDMGDACSQGNRSKHNYIGGGWLKNQEAAQPLQDFLEWKEYREGAALVAIGLTWIHIFSTFFRKISSSADFESCTRSKTWGKWWLHHRRGNDTATVPPSGDEKGFTARLHTAPRAQPRY